jgi:hypothetical protein
MEFKAFFAKCQSEPTVSDFESYLASCIFEKKKAVPQELSLERYSFLRDQAFERRDEEAARQLYELAHAGEWKDGDWDGALR